MSDNTGIDRAAALAKAMVAAPWRRGDEWIIDLMDVEGCGHRMTLYPARNEDQIAAISDDAERWIERVLDRACQREERLIEREATLTRERDEARAEIERLRKRDEDWQRATHVGDPSLVHERNVRLCSCGGANLPEIGDEVDTCWTCCWTCDGLVKATDDSEAAR